MTGVPGWLTDAFLEGLAKTPLANVTAVRAMALPGQARKRDYGLDVEWVEGDLRSASSRAICRCRPSPRRLPFSSTA